MTLIDISWTIVGFALAALFIMMIPAAVELKKTLQGIAKTTEIVNKDLPAILEDLKDTQEKVNAAVNTVNQTVEKTAESINAIADESKAVVNRTRQTVDLYFDQLGTPVAKFLALLAGIRKGYEILCGPMDRSSNDQ